MFYTFDIKGLFFFLMESRRTCDSQGFQVLYHLDIVSSGKHKAWILISLR